MPTESPQPCTHARGPGTTVCLRCRQEERARSAARMQRQVARGGAGVATVVVAAVALYAAAGRLTGGDSSVDPSVAAATPVVQAGDPPDSVPPVSPIPAGPVSPYAPLIAAGESDLGDSVTALRTGDTVTVLFDTEMTRTRRADKFDRLVRLTVPRVFGPTVARHLPTMPLARDGQLTAMLPETGIHVQLDDGWVLRIWPLTREGRDGPLITAYRAIVSR
jgi:hypothetical protein